MEETIFEKILKKEIPSKKVYEDDFVYSFCDINPIAPVHVLVVPKKKIESFSSIDEFSSLEMQNFFLGIQNTIKILDLEDGYRIIFNSGENGRQSVLYIHAHILGGKKLAWKKL